VRQSMVNVERVFLSGNSKDVVEVGEFREWHVDAEYGNPLTIH
jgi:hypothetical protein